MLFVKAFGDSDDAQVTRLWRASSSAYRSLPAQWELKFEDARTSVGLEMNNVAETCMWIATSSCKVAATLPVSTKSGSWL